MKKPKGNFLSIGCGDHQIPLLSAAREKGLRVIGVDRISDAPGFSYCDIRIIESTKEYRKILLGLSKVLMIEPLMGVATRSFGDAVYTTAYLAKKYKLVGNSPESVSLYLSKKKIKSLLEERQVPVPPAVAIKWEKRESGRQKAVVPPLPVLVKPSNGSSKKGIRLIYTEKEFQQLSKGSVAESLLIEEFIHGKEVTVLGMVINSVFFPISLTDKITTKEPPFLEVAHIAPSQFFHMIGELKMICQAIVNATGLTNGAFLAEFKITDRGDCYVMEAAPEVGGEYIADFLLKHHYSYNYFKDLMALYLGEKVEPKLLTKSKEAGSISAIVFQVPPIGKSTVPELKPFPLGSLESIFFEKTFHQMGEKLQFDLGNSQRIRAIGVHSKGENQNREAWIASIQERLQLEQASV